MWQQQIKQILGTATSRRTLSARRKVLERLRARSRQPGHCLEPRQKRSRVGSVNNKQHCCGVPREQQPGQEGPRGAVSASSGSPPPSLPELLWLLPAFPTPRSWAEPPQLPQDAARAGRVGKAARGGQVLLVAPGGAPPGSPLGRRQGPQPSAACTEQDLAPDACTPRAGSPSV